MCVCVCMGKFVRLINIFLVLVWVCRRAGIKSKMSVCGCGDECVVTYTVNMQW